MKFSTRATETIWLTSSLGFCIGVTAAGWVGYIFAVLWAVFIVHCSQCLYRAGRSDGQREGYEAGKEDGIKEELARAEAEEARQLAEWQEYNSALMQALSDTVQERIRQYAIAVPNWNYHEKN